MSNSKFVNFNIRQIFSFALMVSVMLLSFSGLVLAEQGTTSENFKMISSIEYEGKGQFQNQVETMFTVDKTAADNGKTMAYSISTKDFDLVPSGSGATSNNSPKALSFVVDKTDWTITNASDELVFLRKVNNQCVKFLDKVTKDNVGKSWKQKFSFDGFEESLPRELKFKVSTLGVTTEKYGEMIAVRALSDPFAIKAEKANGKGTGVIRSRVNVAYLFDSKVEDVYLSISVFEAETKISGFKEKLQHEIATYKTDANGAELDLSGLGKDFEKFVRKVGLSSSKVEVTEEAVLPLWAHSVASGSAQVANISGAIACEGATNPVLMVCIPTVHTVSMQSIGLLGPGAQFASVGGSLATGVPAMGTMNFAAGPAFMGVGGGFGTAAAVGGAAAGGGVAAGGGGGGGGGGTSTPVSP